MVHLGVFISSTHNDLIPHRQAARDALLACDLFPIMMEYFAAMDNTAVDLCMRKVDQSEVYIGIFAHRYGFCPLGSDISITHMEFDRATRNGIPRLCFLVDTNAEWPPEHIESEPGQSRLQQFKDSIEASLVRATFTTPDSLKVEILKALRALESDLAGRRNGSVPSAAVPLYDQIRIQAFLEERLDNLDDFCFVLENRVRPAYAYRKLAGNTPGDKSRDLVRKAAQDDGLGELVFQIGDYWLTRVHGNPQVLIRAQLHHDLESFRQELLNEGNRERAEQVQTVLGKLIPGRLA